jgi:hypothetical protein
MSSALVRIFNAIPLSSFSAAAELRNRTYTNETLAMLIPLTYLWYSRAQYILAA